MVGPAEIARRASSRVTGRLQSLPILALSVHSACNCKCVMCDIWKANAEKREISEADLDRHIDDIRALNVQRVMMTGGEPLLHRNLWALCGRLQSLGVRITLVTTGLLLARQAAEVTRHVDTVVISLDGDREVHDQVRRVKGGFNRIAEGVVALRAERRPPKLIARTVVQRRNFVSLGATVAAAYRLGFDELSFLAADVSTPAFNRPDPWTTERIAEIAVPGDDLTAFQAAIERAVAQSPRQFRDGFVAGGRASLDRILEYYTALAGRGDFPAVRCNAPWVSAVLEADHTLRPCFFQPPYGLVSNSLQAALNDASAIAFRRQLRVERNETCQRCVCSLNLPLSGAV